MLFHNFMVRRFPFPRHRANALAIAVFPRGANGPSVLQRRCYACVKVSSRLATSLFGIYLRTPVLAASGTFGYGAEFKSLLDLESIAGNPPPRLFETRAGMINSVGLQNMGVRAFLRDRLPELRKIDVPIFANMFGHTIDDYVEVARVLEDAEGLAAYELNVSCPNTKRGGLYFSSHPGLLSEVVWAVRA